MRLISLTCDQPSFHPVIFNETGLNIIIGDGLKDNEGSSNGVGKTLTLGLIHHCLGAKVDNKLAATVPDWWFSLLFNVNGKEYRISRTGNDKKILLNDDSIKLNDLRKWLDCAGIFNMQPNMPFISFRSLFKRFARYYRSDCDNPMKTIKEPDFDSLLRTLYLLGVDYSLVINKRQNKLELEQINQATKNWEQDTILRDMFRAGAKPRVRAEWLDREIPRLKADLNNYQVAENYRSLESDASILTKSIRDLEKEQSIILFQLESIEKSLTEHPDISKKDLLDLYEGLLQIFKPEILAHFEAVEKFHNSLAINRKARLESDKLRLLDQLQKTQQKIEVLSLKRDKKMNVLQGKRALDEYAALAKQVAELDEERQRLIEYLNFSSKLQEKAQKIRERRVEEDRLTAEYIVTNPLSKFDTKFADIAEIMYPRTPAGIVLESNTGDNQLRYNLTIQIEGDDSDGINAARIMIFDWIVLMYGSNHNVNMLWHDNRLFADIDPGVRSRWFSFINNALEKSGKQYIATLNTENFNTMKEIMSEETQKKIDASVILTLSGDKPENKLLGIQFGKSPS